MALGMMAAMACLQPPDPGAKADANANLCHDAFGHLEAYTLCQQEGDVCSFYVSLDRTLPDIHCAQLCEEAGAECLNGFDAPTSVACEREIEEGCFAPHLSMVCVCRPNAGAR